MLEVRRGGAQREPAPSCCARCGAPFRCGIDDAGGCWCAKLPPLAREAYSAGVGCWCEACLTRALQEARD